MTVYIYALCDPETGEVRYVGKTCYTLKKRLRGHLNDPSENHKTHWVRDIVQRGLKPRIEVLETIENSDDTDWQGVERFWILYLRFLGCRLTNSENGGVAGKRLSDETKKKLSAAHKGKIMTPEHRANIGLAQKGKIVTIATRIKLKERFIGIPRSPETIAKMSASRTGVKLGPMSLLGRMKLSLRKGEKRKPLSEERKAQISAFMKTRPRNPESYLKVSLALKGRKKSPEHIEKLRQSLLGRKLSPETIAKRTAKIKGRPQSPQAIANRVASRAANKAAALILKTLYAH